MSGILKDLQSILDENGTIILDGGLSSELERQGADLSGSLWSARVLREDPDLIYRTHKAYYVAGADVGTTASYQATVKGFQQLGIDEAAAEDLLRNSVLLAAKARDDFWNEYQQGGGKDRRKPLVAASVGCYGASLADGSEFHGTYRLTSTKDQLKDFHRRRLLILAGAGADILACETVPCILEAEAIAELLEEAEVQALGVPAWISVSFSDGAKLASGESLADLAAALFTPSGARGGGLLFAVGLNCGPPEHAAVALATLGAAAQAASGGTKVPLVCYPNKGEEWDVQAKAWVKDTALPDDRFACACRTWRSNGARLIGGCCRTTPETITGIRAALS